MLDMYLKELTKENVSFEIDHEASDESLIVLSCASEQEIIEPIIDKVTRHFGAIKKRLK